MAESQPIFWAIFSLSFLVALTGAMSPGPLLTYTIVESVKTRRRGYLTGFKVIFGHAILEVGIILLILLGLGALIRNETVIRTIGLTGGAILIWFGISIVGDVWKGRIKADFLETGSTPPQEQRNLTGSNRNQEIKFGGPVAGGVLVSMANPYWWIWWATIGLAFMAQYDVSFAQWPNLVAFFLGHEAGDLSWYVIVSFLSFFGLRKLKKSAYHGLLVTCGVFMITFGVYLGVSPFFSGSA